MLNRIKEGRCTFGQMDNQKESREIGICTIPEKK
jgi:hypothetical protein